MMNFVREKGPALFRREPHLGTDPGTIAVANSIAPLSLGHEQPAVGLLQEGLRGQILASGEGFHPEAGRKPEIAGLVFLPGAGQGVIETHR